jgi:hypothetical protein
LLGNGDGTFQPPLTTSVAGGGFVVAGDFNHDNKLDFALDDGFVTVFLGNGDGTFQPGVEYGSDGTSEAFVTGDFNRDGLIDFAITNFNSNNPTHVSTLLGNGDGTFGHAATYAIPQGALGIISADFNKDGKPDLATVNLGENFSILLGTGQGKFASAVDYSVSGGDYGVIVSADFNGDGYPDIATLNSSAGTVSINLNQGNGTFAPYKDYPAMANIDALVSGDFNNDGNIDLIAGSAGGGLALLLGNGTGGFSAPVSFAPGLSPYQIAVADFNGDGILDLATVTGSILSNSVSVLLGQGSGVFGAPVSYTAGSGPVDVLAADFNHDGKIDLAVLTSGLVWILLGNGDGTFQNAVSYAGPGYPLTFFAADFHGNNHLDLAVVSSSPGNDAYILPGDGKGHFGSFVPYYAGAAPISLVAADFDQNGSVDLATANDFYSAGTVTVLLNEPVISLFPANLDFPQTGIGSKSEPLTVTFSNPGTTSLAIQTIKISGADSEDFSETSTCAANLKLGKNCDVSVVFQPTKKGTRSATLTVTDDALSGSQTVSLLGTAK